jgi:predicted PurR-regulated permease PerM
MPQAKPVGFGLPTDEEGGAIDVKTIIEANSAIKQFEDTIRKINEEQMTKLDEAWLNIGETLAKGIYASIDAISKSLAEAIILGKDLGNAFKEFVQNAIVNALSALISFVLQKVFLYALEKLFGIEIKKEIDLEKQKLATMKSQTRELAKQVALKAILMFLGGFAEGGRVSGKAEGGRVQGYRASGGQTSATNAYMVGETG